MVLDKVQVTLLSKKDEQTFSSIYTQTNKAIYALIFSYTHNHEITKDLLQETYMKLLEKIHQYKTNKPFMNWFMQLAKNHTIDYLRREKKMIHDQSLIDQKASKAPPTDDAAKVMMLLKDLDQVSQQIVMLKAVESYTFEAIGKLLHLPTGTVQWKYYEAIKTIERSL